VDGNNTLVMQPGVAEEILKVPRDEKLREKLIEVRLETAKRWT
jgi:hypothetical protein